MANPGKRFEGKLSDSLEAAGLHTERIPDKLYWTGHRVVSEETPADFIATYAQSYNGVLHSFLIEAKACSKNRLPFDNLKDHQRVALLDHDSIHENAHGIIAINYYDKVNLNRLDVCFMVPIDVWAEYEGGKMKSISHDECLEDDRITLCPKVKGAVYDMAKWLGGYRL